MANNDTALLSRRKLLKSMFLGTAAVGIPGITALRARADEVASALPLPSGPLANIPEIVAKTLSSGAIPGVDDEVWAPPGFEVRCVARQGLNPLTGQADPDGYEWHLDPDGGAVFPSEEDGGWVYVSNSEETPGGVGALRFDSEGNIIDAYSILEGSRNNCAGGPTPWGTWLSCEETGAGYVWECDPFGTPDDAVRKEQLGALNHEAAAIDPINHVCYETEDGGTQRFYRFVSAADDLTILENGVTRMGFESGTLQVMNIKGFEDGAYPDAASLREPTPVTWTTPPACVVPVDLPIADFPYGVCDGIEVIRDGFEDLFGVDVPGLLLPGYDENGNSENGTYFASAEGIWYHEIPEELRQIPPNGSVPTRGVMFFTTKGDNRVWAYDIENELIEIIYDNENMQMETGFNQVDNLVVSPAGDVLVAEDGALMRLVVVVPNGQAKLLMQITKGGSEITGPAFTPDGSRLYFSSQRGPSGADGSGTGGATYEITIPPEFRTRVTVPTPSPTQDPTSMPSSTPTPAPTGQPTVSPTASPSVTPAPSSTPSPAATIAPLTEAPSRNSGGGAVGIGLGAIAAGAAALKSRSAKSAANAEDSDSSETP